MTNTKSMAFNNLPSGRATLCKRQIGENHRSPARISIGLKGEFTLKVRDCRGRIKRRLKFDNLITDNGLNIFASASNNFLYCVVGSGTATPAYSDTQLGSFKAWASVGTVTAGYTTAPNTCYKIYPASFAAGKFNNTTVTEIGLSNTTNGTAIFNRALIRDSNGNPVTLTLQSDEYLDVTYKLIWQLPDVDIPFTTTINSVVYTGFIRATGMGSTNWQPFSGGYNMSAAISTWYSYTGNAVASTSTAAPAGTGTTSTTATFAAYVAGNKYMDFTGSWAPAKGALSIKTVYAYSNFMRLQIQFDTAVSKTAAQTFAMTVRISWDRV